MKEKILVIDDDSEFLELTKTWLDQSGFQTITEEDGIQGIRQVYSSRPDMVVVDINMPKLDGWQVCRRIRDMSDIPIIIATVNGQTSDVVRGFNLGIDDYITKPIEFIELIARIRAILRRSENDKHNTGKENFNNGKIEVDWRSHQVYVRGKAVKLSPTEFRVLSCLIENKGWIVTHEQLLQKAWGPNYIGDKSFVKLYVGYLRKKIESNPKQPKSIITERGIGYRFAI